MNKKQFLKELSTRLDILTEEEKKDILEEYGSVIDEKIRNGQDEQDAIGDFGDIDELVEEILKAYKINPDYARKEKEDKEFSSESFENFVKNGASWLSKVTKKVAKSITKAGADKPHVVFEILIKAFIYLIIIALLRLPFLVLNYIGEEMLFPMFGPFEYLFAIILKIITFSAYFVLCVIIAIHFFKEYYSNEEISLKEEKKEQETQEQELKDISRSKNKDSDYKVDKKSSVVPAFLKIILLIVFLIPFHLVLVGLSIGLVVLLFLLYKSLDVWGLIIIFIGLIMLFSYFIYLIRSVYKKYHPASIIIFIISLIMITFGSLITFETYSSLTYHDEVHPELRQTEKRFETTIDGNIVINNKINSIRNIVYEVDPTLLDGEVVIVAQYYNDFYNLKFVEGRNTIRIHNKRKIRYPNEVLDIIISDLNKKEIYNYSHFANFKLKIISNEKTQNKISVR